MPLFYFFSAYFFRDEKVTNNYRQFVVRKFKNLYWPYIKWSFIFLLLHNVFFYIGFYDNSLSWQDIYVNAKRAVLGSWQDERMLGAYWFLISLFWESLLFGTIIFVKHKINNRYFDLVTIILLFVVGYFSPVDFKMNREMVLLPIFYMGYLASKYKVDLSSNRKHLALALLVCLPLLLCGAFFVRIEVGQSVFGNPLLFLLGAFLGIYLVMIISDMLSRISIGRWLDVLGRATMNILTFHFLSFKVLTLLFVVVGICTEESLSQWPVPSGHGYNNLWLLYTLAGVVGPMACQTLIKRLLQIHNS